MAKRTTVIKEFQDGSRLEINDNYLVFVYPSKTASGKGKMTIANGVAIEEVKEAIKERGK